MNRIGYNFHNKQIMKNMLVLVLLVIFFVTLYAIWEYKFKRKRMDNQVMSKDIAYNLVKAWVNFAKEDIDQITFDKDDSFYGQVGAPYFEYRGNILIVRGLVYSEDEYKVSDIKGAAEVIKSVEENQSQRMAGGYFDENLNKPEPDFNLRRDFANGNISNKEFINNVENLMEASTWWRKVGFYDEILMKIK